MSDTVIFRFSLGQTVYVPTDCAGTVTGQCRKDTGKAYLVVWWCESKRNDEWLYEFELRESL